MAISRGLVTFAQNRPVLFIVVAATVFGATGFAAAVTISQTTYSGLFGDITNVGTSLSVSSTAIRAIKSTAAAAGATSGTAIEMVTSSAGVANTALTKANWRYEAVVQESAIASVTSGTFKVELLKDDTSVGALYMTQATSDGAAVETVTFRWDVGADMPTGDTAFQLLIASV